jgi:hypothetical protein
LPVTPATISPTPPTTSSPTTLATPPPPLTTFNADNYSWNLIFGDKNASVFINPKTLSIDDGSNGIVLVKITFVYPENYNVQKTNKKLMSMVGIMVANCKEKQYRFIVVQAIYTDNTSETFQLPMEADVKKITISDTELAHPTKYTTMMFVYINAYYAEKLKAEENVQKHIKYQRAKKWKNI